jgi:hypothetical protein
MTSIYSKTASLLAFSVIIIFVSFYKTPPLVDLHSHVSLGMIHGELFKYYFYHPGFSYRFFDSIIRFWNLLLHSHHHWKVALFSYLSVLFFLFFSIYLFCRLNKQDRGTSLLITGILAGPTFLLFHTMHFFYGSIPFLLAVLASVLSSTALWALDSNWVATGKIKLYPLNLFIISTALAIYSHLAGFIYLAMTWSIPVIHGFLIKEKRLQRLSALFLIVLIMLSMAWLCSHNTHSANKIFEYHFDPLRTRLQWLSSGGPYNAFELIPHNELGFLKKEKYRYLLTTVPYACLYFLICRLYISALLGRLKKEPILWFISLELILAISLVIIAPTEWWSLGQFFSRQWMCVVAWTLFGMAYFLSLLPTHVLRRLVYTAPVFALSACLLLQPIYANFQKLPLEDAANDYAHQLLIAVNNYKKQHPETMNKTIVIRYLPNVIYRDWVHYITIPFIAMHSKALLQHHIIIQEHWYLMPWLPISWQEEKMRNAIYLDWNADMQHNKISTFTLG